MSVADKKVKMARELHVILKRFDVDNNILSGHSKLKPHHGTASFIKKEQEDFKKESEEEEERGRSKVRKFMEVSEEPEDLMIESFLTEKQRRYQNMDPVKVCKSCFKEFKDLDVYYNHCQTEKCWHYICESCGDTFLKENDARSHCTAVRCNLCHQTFSCESFLKKHCFDFTCPMCKKMFCFEDYMKDNQWLVS